VLLACWAALPRWAAAAAASGETDYALCNSNGVSSALSNNVASLRSFYSSPIRALVSLTAVIHAGVGTDYADFSPPSGNWPPRIQQLSPIYGEALYDDNVDRTMESYIGPPARTTEYDSLCAFEAFLASNESEVLPDPQCLLSRSDVLTDRCAALFPECPDAQASLLVGIPFQTWNNGSTPYCPIYCLQPALYNNSFINFLWQYSNPFASMIASIAAAEEGQTEVLQWHWCDKRDITRMYPSQQQDPWHFLANNTASVRPDTHSVMEDLYLLDHTRAHPQRT